MVNLTSRLGALVLVACLLGGGGATGQVVKVPDQIAWEISREGGLLGPIRRGVADAGGIGAYLATTTSLYRVEDGRPRVIAKPPQPDAQLVLAPGGQVFAWLIPSMELRGLATVVLSHLPEGALGPRLRLEEAPFGFSDLYLGFQGKLIVTASPLDNFEALGGRFLYTFWDREGR